MKKINPNLKSRALSFLSFQILFIITFSLITNPVAALGAKNAKLVGFRGETQSAKSSGALIPSTVFSNPAAINIPDSQLSSVQSNITVSGTSGPISSITLTLNNFTASQGAADFDILLVGPGGQKFIVMSDVGGNFDPMTNATITLSDAGATLLPNTGSIVSGTFKPTDYGANANLPAPAPAGAYSTPATAGSATFNSVFGGLSGASVDGTWSLFVADDTSSGGTGATIAGGWSLNIITTAAAPTTTTVMSSLNPSFTNQAVTFTSTTTSSSTVNTGTVTFVDQTTSVTLCSNVPVNGSGVATCLAPANTLTERRHTIQATYNPNATFATSNGSIVQTVNCPTTQVSNTFTNGCGITLVDNQAQSIPYPSNIIVSGLSGSISKVTLTLTNTNLSNTNDHNFLLVGPAGQTFVFFSDAGGSGATSGANITFDDAAASNLPNSGSIASGNYKPTDYAGDSDPFPSPAPAGPYNLASPAGTATFASVYGGAAPNGTWSLYPVDDTASAGAGGTIGSWSLTFTTSGDAATTTTLTSNPNPSTTAQSFLLTATVTSTSTVNAGTVTFRQGATTFCANVAVVSGTATCNVPAQPQGTYVFTADYNGAPGQFNISSGNVTQQVNSPTIVSCLNFANNGGITVANANIANPYPSNITVSGLGGTITKVTLSLNGLTTPTPDDLDLLLVGPSGQTFVFMSDAGGANALSNVNLTFDDAAATAIPDGTAIVAGTYRPGSYVGGGDGFPAPAPAGPYNRAQTEGAATFATVYNGIVPNGTWSLYAIEDAGDAVNTTISGWSLTFTLSAVATTTSVSSSANPSVFGQPVTFTATVTTAGLGTPNGNVQFFDGATPIGGAVALNGSGQAQVTTSLLTVGNHTITANYAGSSSACLGTYNASSGSLASGQQVNKANTTTSVTSSGSPSATGQTRTFTATISPVAPGAGTRTGTVTFFRNGVAICSNVAVNASGQATCNITFTVAGNYNITATYSGDTNFNASNNNASPFVQQVLGPTAANVGISGRIMSSETGRAVGNARIVMIDSTGQTHVALSNPFGYFRFTDVPSGATYTFTVTAKGYQTQSVVRNVVDETTDLDILLENQ